MASTFDDLNLAAQSFAEDNMGETFSYTSPTNVVTSGLVGVFSQVTQEFQFSDFTFKKNTDYNVVSGKVQWGSVVPANRGIVADSSGGTYQIEHISGAVSAGEPAYELNLKKLT